MRVKSFRISSLQLVVFPLVFMILQVLHKTDYHSFYLSVHDPAYAFLFNGLNIALGNFELGLSGFPGTTLQCLVALNLKIADIFCNYPNLAHEVLMNPESFLHVLSMEIIALNTIALLILGFITYRQMHSIALSLALQLTPFIALKAFNTNSVVMLEPLLLCVNLLLLLFVAGYAFGNKTAFRKKDVILMAILMALGISTKTVFLPVVFLPVFAIKGFRNLLLYVAVMLVSLGIFLIPVYPTFSSFIAWYVTILTHTGIYGSGNYDLFDPAIYLGNIKRVFNSNVFFTVAFAAVMAASILLLVPRFRHLINEHRRRILFGIAAVFLGNILMAAKHFSSHYLYVSYNLVVFAFVLLLSMIPFPDKIRGSIPLFKTATIYVVGILLVIILIQGIDFSPGFRNPRLKGIDFIQRSVQNAPRIIVLESPGPFIETALFHGLAYSAGMKPTYAQILKQRWPSTYFYNKNGDALHDWIHEYNLTDVLSMSPTTYIYQQSEKKALPEKLAAALIRLSDEGCIKKFYIAYQNTEPGEYIYRLKTDVVKTAGKVIPGVAVTCDFEKMSADSNHFTTSHPSLVISRTDLQTNEFHVSGSTGIKLSREQPFGPGFLLPALQGFYKISVFRRASDGKGLVVAADTTGTRFYKSNGIPSRNKDGWDYIELVVNIPETLVGETISVYLWYPGKRSCYFDDLEITFYKVKI